MIVMFGIGGLVLFSSQSGVFQIPTCGALICGDTHDPSGYHSDSYYSLRPTFFVLFEKSNFLREHHLLSCLPFKNVEVSKTTLKKIYPKIELVN